MHITDEQPFLDAIFDRYDDDRPRLMYADFLDEAGEFARAELIRIQLALTRLKDDDPRIAQLRERQTELLTRNQCAWSNELAGLAAVIDFRRGIPDSATVEAETLLAHGRELFAKLRLRRLRLLNPTPVLAKLAALPLLGSLHELDFCGADLRDDDIRLLMKSPFLKRIESLDLGFNKLTDASITTLARAGEMPHLACLALNDNETITSQGMIELASSPFFAGLQTLDVSGNDIDATGITALAASQSLDRLRAVRMNGNRIGEGGVAALAESSLLPRMLRSNPTLELRDNLISVEGAAALARCPALAVCNTLDLSNNDLSDAGTIALLASPHFHKLNALLLARNKITDSGISQSREFFHTLFDHIRFLDLSGNRLTRVGMSILSTVRGSRPVRIEISSNIQMPMSGDAPVAVADLMSNLLDSVEAARLKHLIANPRERPAPG